MSYATQAQMSVDQDLRVRIAACYAAEGGENPLWWAEWKQWQLCATPGWDAAYASAIANGAERPGHAGAVVTDDMILSAVQPLALAERELE